jgi:MFS family permease
MPPVLVLVAALVMAIAAGVRSTWSPCGLSMLSSITPLAERGRHRRFGWTAAWFVLGGALGGMTLGLGTSIAAAVVGWAGLDQRPVGVAVMIAAALAVALDVGALPPALPHHRRQVNELWLHRYRGWVNGLGFGWQIGNGVATYIMTAGVYLVAVLAVLTGQPAAALATGTLFGLVRGLAVLLVARVTNPARLARVHRRLDETREPVRVAVIGVQAAVAVVASLATGGPVAGLAVIGLISLVAAMGTSSPAVDRRPAPAR